MPGADSKLADEISRDVATRETIRMEQHSDLSAAEISANVRTELGLPYGDVGGRKLTLDLFTPKNQPARPRPAIIFLHGGGWWMGKPAQFHFHSSFLAARYGFFAVNVDYRLSGEAQFPAPLQDAKCAVRWVRSKCGECNIDPERIAIGGGSAGAHLASLVLTTAGVPEYEGSGGNAGYGSEVNLGIFFNGEFDLWDLVGKEIFKEPMRRFLGGLPDDMPDQYSAASSIRRIHTGVPPVLFLHGTEDKCVSHEQSLAFHRKLIALGIHSEIELYDGKPHAWFNFEPDRTITLRRMERFLVEQFHLPSIAK
ncbi:MAG: alpha/beta hydrolase [Lentisphaerae bacterium]|nr:alpha/beta hydrolase [Lentisphaerota bacterium]